MQELSARKFHRPLPSMAAHDRKPMGDCGLIIFTGLMIATVTEGPLHWTKRVSIRVGPRSADLLHVVDATN
jgi:hypothetical protein